MACGNDFRLAMPNQRRQRQHLRAHIDHGLGRLIWCAWVDNSDTAVVADKGQNVSGRRESDVMYPACRVIHIFAADRVEW